MLKIVWFGLAPIWCSFTFPHLGFSTTCGQQPINRSHTAMVKSWLWRRIFRARLMSMPISHSASLSSWVWTSPKPDGGRTRASDSTCSISEVLLLKQMNMLCILTCMQNRILHKDKYPWIKLTNVCTGSMMKFFSVGTLFLYIFT